MIILLIIYKKKKFFYKNLPVPSNIASSNLTIFTVNF